MFLYKSFSISRGILGKMFEIIWSILFALVIVFFILTIAKILAPVFTFLFIVLITGLGWQTKKGQIMSMMGIVLYLSSWGLCNTLSPLLIQLICGVGVLMWMSASLISTESKKEENLHLDV